jgi:hypothetical protein
MMAPNARTGAAQQTAARCATSKDIGRDSDNDAAGASSPEGDSNTLKSDDLLNVQQRRG